MGSGFIKIKENKIYVFTVMFNILITLPQKISRSCENKIENSLEYQSISARVKSYFPNYFELYNMCGNVAEMIEEKGLVKGGSYNDPAHNVRISSEVKYSKPQADIGFRIAMKIIEE